MKLIDQPISITDLSLEAEKLFGDMTKAVVDLEKEVMVINAELHADQEALLIQQGSKQSDLWGINLYPELFGEEDFIEFDSMINLRPSGGNTSRGVDDPKTQQRIRDLVSKLIIS